MITVSILTHQISGLVVESLKKTTVEFTHYKSLDSSREWTKLTGIDNTVFDNILGPIIHLGKTDDDSELFVLMDGDSGEPGVAYTIKGKFIKS